MFSNPPDLLHLEPHSEDLRQRIWWWSASNATVVWAAEHGIFFQSSTLKEDESDKPFHVQQAEQIRLYKESWKKAEHEHEPWVSVSRSILPIVNYLDCYYFGLEVEKGDKFGYIENDKRTIFGRSYTGEPDKLIQEFSKDEAIQEATLLLTIPNTL